MGKPCKQREPAPNKNPDYYKELARELICPPADQRSGNHVCKEECAGQQAQLRVTDNKFLLDLGLHREQRITINVVKNIERGQYRQHQTRIKFWRHRFMDVAMDL